MKDVREDDWANNWKQYFKPLRVSDRLTIKPTWEEYTPESPDERIIELDPGMAFGTGTHPTTSLCLRTLEGVIPEGDEVIDVGTGSGILADRSMSVRCLPGIGTGSGSCSGIQCQRKCETEQSRITIQVMESDLLSVLKQDKTISLNVTLPVRVVVANILAEIILLFLDDAYQALQPGGYYIASGIYKNKEQVVKQALLTAGFEITETAREEDWVAFVARKR